MNDYGHSPEVEVDLAKMLDSVFAEIRKYYHRDGEVAWSGGKGAAFDRFMRQRDYCVQTRDVHDWLQNQNGEIDWRRVHWHKTIALTQHCILLSQPVDFNDIKDDPGRRYNLNVDFAHLFGLEFMARRHELWHKRHSTSKKEFDTKAFLYPFNHTNEGKDFLRELRNLLLIHGEKQIMLFWAAQLWYATGRWGIEYMRTGQ